MDLEYVDFGSFLIKLCRKNNIAKMRQLQVQLDFVSGIYISLVFSFLPVVQCLCLDSYFFERLRRNINEGLINDLRRLEPQVLELIRLRLHCSLVNYFVLKLLYNSRSLQRLYCQFSEHCWCRDIKPPHDSSCDMLNIEHGNLPSLKYVELVCVSDTDNELKFIKTILKCAPLLELMTIKVSEKVTEAEDKLRMAIKFMQYSRASSNAQIIFKTGDH